MQVVFMGRRLGDAVARLGEARGTCLDREQSPRRHGDRDVASTLERDDGLAELELREHGREAGRGDRDDPVVDVRERDAVFRPKAEIRERPERREPEQREQPKE
ncbi:MAG: hypothetical protein WEF50_02580 [Myxococcota bacterium]